MHFLSIIVLSVFAFMCVGFLLALFTERNDIADIMWGLGFIFISCLAAYLGNSTSIAATLAHVLVIIWGLRLTVRLIWRSQGKGEDYRYAKWREEWMENGFVYFAVRSFLQVFMLQGLLMLIISLPLIFIQIFSLAMAPDIVWIGFGIWLIGFLWETVSDIELDQFLAKKSNKGKVLRTGLWKYSRHPNYFGEATMWWGIWVMSLSVGYSVWPLIVSPLLITYLLVYVSGIPMVEEQWKRSRKYKEYKAVTSAFIPRLPGEQPK